VDSSADPLKPELNKLSVFRTPLSKNTYLTSSVMVGFE